MCGLFGYSGTVPVSKDKFFILGLINEARGKDSCGYYNGEEVYKFHGKESEFSVMAQEFSFDPGEGKMILGHVRKKSSGTYKVKHIHPVLVEEQGEFTTIVTHNGTITNDNGLAQDWFKDRMTLESDTYILAKILNEIAAKDKDYADVLSKYTGNAALAWTHPAKEDDLLYLWKGAKQHTVERPLYIYEGKDQLYYSSLEEALHIIAEDRSAIREVPDNTLLTVFEGTVILENEIKRKAPVYHYGKNAFDKVKSSKTPSQYRAGVQTSLITFSEERKLKNTKAYGPKVYFNKELFLYMRSGSLITGEYKLKYGGEVIKGNEVPHITAYFYQGYHVSKSLYNALMAVGAQPTIVKVTGKNKHRRFSFRTSDLIQFCNRHIITASTHIYQPISFNNSPTSYFYLNGEIAKGNWTSLISAAEVSLNFQSGKIVE